MTGRTLVLLRHGRTAWNDSGQAQGHADVELDEVGHAQAADAAPYVAAFEPVALWTSDLARAAQTATYVERATGLVATHDPRLREVDVGSRQGLTLAEFAATYPEEHAAWLCGDDSRPVPGAETAADLLARTLPALREYLGQLPPGGTGLVVGHGAALMAGLLGMVGWPQDLAGGLRYLSNCGWAVLGENEVDGPVRLMAYNQRATAGAPGLLTP